MSFGIAVDVAIGLILVFLLVGLLASALQELIAALLAMRGRVLRRGLAELLASRSGDGLKGSFFAEVYGHPLLRGVAGKGLPSYVPSRNFALAVIEVLKDESQAPVVTQMEAGIGRLPDGPLRRSLAALLADAAGDYDAFKATLETWFDGAMDRVSGVYKRYATILSLFIGLAVALALNIDTLRIGEALWNDPDLRGALVAAAEQYVKQAESQQQREPPPNPDTGGANSPRPSTSPTADAAAPDDPDVEAAAAAEATVRELKARILALANELGGLPIPIGWPDGFLKGVTFAAILGWLLTALSTVFGAPFWFDLLQQVLNLRAAGPKPARAPGEAVST